MRHFGVLCRRQWAAFFLSPLAYVVMTVFLAVSGLSFWRLMAQNMEEPMKIGDLLFGSVFFWIMALVSIALISMSLLSEERRSGTIETLLTAPVSDVEVVLAKYCAGLLFFTVLCLPTLLYLPIVGLFSSGMGPVDPAPVILGYLMLLLMAGFYMAFGVFVSAMTRSQMVAAMICFAGISLMFFADYFQYVARGTPAERVLGAVSSIQHILDFSRGVFDTRPIVLYGTGIVFFLFASIKVLEARQWK